MSHSRLTASIVSLAILFANACCLAHVAPQHVTASVPSIVHACCHKTVKAQTAGEKPQPAQSCNCCRRVDATANAGPDIQHAPLLLAFSAMVAPSVDELSLCSLASPFHFNAHGPPGCGDVLQQSCSLIL